MSRSQAAKSAALQASLTKLIEATPDNELHSVVKAMIDIAPGTAEAFRTLLLIFASPDRPSTKKVKHGKPTTR